MKRKGYLKTQYQTEHSVLQETETSLNNSYFQYNLRGYCIDMMRAADDKNISLL